jgi:hypothetical protein
LRGGDEGEGGIEIFDTLSLTLPPRGGGILKNENIEEGFRASRNDSETTPGNL